ncbi:Nuf2 family-domain-containing protein [Lipomyces oligophaga]|uniref:Nuf2 family-domain-containing protein n=1 Tax=Lipomyces oligophaga TaxID=45792 RepID=UPI0034CF338E
MSFSARKSSISFSARQSSAYKPSNNNSNALSASAGGRPQMYADVFPLLEFPEIALCLRGCDIPVAEDMLQKPTSAFVISLYEQMIGIFLGMTYDQQMAISDSCAQGRDVYESGRIGRSVLSLVRAASKLMKVCGIDDFSMADILRPEPQRTRRLLSAVVNFARFREAHSNVTDELMAKSEALSVAAEEAYLELVTDNDRLEQLRAQKEEEAPKLKEAQVHFKEVEEELIRYRKIQEKIVTEHDTYKKERFKLLEKHENLSSSIAQIKKEVERLRPYVLEVPNKLTKVNEEKSESVQVSKATIDKLERSLRSYDDTFESIKTIEQDINICLKIMEDVENDIFKQDEASRQLTRLMQLRDQRQLEVHEVERNLTHLKRQLTHAEERAERLQEQRLSKRESAQKRTQEQKETYAMLVAERSVVKQEMSKKNALIAGIEKQKQDLCVKLEDEVRINTNELVKLEKHVELYISEMMQTMEACG